MRARLPVLLSLCTSLLTISVACTDSVGPANQITPPTLPAVVQTVTLSPAQATLAAGGHVIITATPVGPSGKPVTMQITWSSSDSAIATVSDSGDVVAVAPGNAVITAAANGVYASAPVTVTQRTPTDSLRVAPEKADLVAGKTLQLAVTTGGQPVTQGVTWESSDTAVASVSSSGLVTGVAGGIASIRANYGGQVSTSAITVLLATPVTPPPEGPSAPDSSGTTENVVWAHRPAGFTTLTDNPYNELAPSGWGINNPGGKASIISDPTAPLSPSNVMEMRYPIGFTADGVAPATAYYIFKPWPRELYIGFYWKPSNPWQGHESGINKIVFVMFNSGQALTLKMDGQKGGPYYLRCTLAGDAATINYNAQNRIPVKLGEWHKVELYLKMDSNYGAGDGIARWWMDGQLIGSYTDLSYPNFAGFEEFQFSPTWGGRGTIPKQENDYFRFDHVIIAKK